MSDQVLIFDTNEWLKASNDRAEFRNPGYGVPKSMAPIVRRRATMKDGFSISIQASYAAYCTPRMSNATSYKCVELGYPNEVEELLMDYIEDPDEPTATVYAYVPVELVNSIIKKHGGIIL